MSALFDFSDAEIRAEYARRFKKAKASASEPARVPCTVPSEGTKPKSAAQAAKARRVRMEQCLCRLCAACLSPASTFAAQTALVGRPYPTLNPLADL